ncbi:hypothetical protein CEXT_788801 [Caerostris extrusa]|uniref:Uncharacterized protein n=1 Tax=Caerostris extrusa TaxID=172846 RepID=A0AAV4QXU8_CAEEX|nr:hypothetical protein CEXT_788801 [Caerostris extrusa]
MPIYGLGKGLKPSNTPSEGVPHIINEIGADKASWPFNLTYISSSRNWCMYEVTEQAFSAYKIKVSPTVTTYG